MNRVFSGIQPTHDLHIGNYLGAIRQWVASQGTEESLFCVVDLHALSVKRDPQRLAKDIRSTVATYIACGIDPDKNVIFIQSHVPVHAELSWVLSCMTPMGWLNRMTQFKDKAGKHKELANLGLYAYPVLQAADILAYKATQVPVGEDQKQHIELSRDIAGAFNARFDVSFFPLPEPIISNSPESRVMSLRDGTSKMSKSDESQYSRIHLTDDADTIALKIRKAKTDADPIAGSFNELERRPEAKNLISIYGAFSGETPDQVCQRFSGALFSQFKTVLTEILVEKITPLGKVIHDLTQDQEELDRVIRKGAEKATVIASQTWKEVRQIIGLA